MHYVLGIMGIILWAAAIWLIRDGLAMTTTVPSDGAFGPTGEVANFSLMHIQGLQVQLGGIAAIVGTLLVCGALIMGYIQAATDRFYDGPDAG